MAKLDEALLNVSQSIRAAIDEIEIVSTHGQANKSNPDLGLLAHASTFPRSSNLRLKKEFSEAERDQFLFDSFDYMERFFQGSLTELQARNAEIETRFHKPDGDSFVATIYISGKKIAACGIRRGGAFGHGISYSHGDSAPTNSMNESLSIGADDQKLYLSPTMRMHHFGNFSGGDNEKLSNEGASEYYWSILIRPLKAIELLKHATHLH